MYFDCNNTTQTKEKIIINEIKCKIYVLNQGTNGNGLNTELPKKLSKKIIKIVNSITFINETKVRS